MSGAKAIAGVIGWPIAHSRSPLLHGWWLERHGVDGAYLPFAVQPERVGDAVRGLAGLGLKGVNVTIPHKEAALERADTASPTALRIGAANMLTVDAEGAIHADNSDAYGFAENLRAGLEESRWRDRPALLLGAGGAARAVAVALLNLGVASLHIANRTVERADALAAALDDRATGHPIGDAPEIAKVAGLIVNCTASGMGGDGAPIDLAAIDSRAAVVDTVYTPLETPLLRAARARGLATLDGLGMLIHQGRPGFRAWFGVDPIVDPAVRALLVADLER